MWLYYHIEGVKAQGLGNYLLHFAFPPGVPKAMAPLMLPIELISHTSRVMSLTLRLFGNIFGEHLVVLIIGSIVPFLAPLPIQMLGLIVGPLQAFIFMTLTGDLPGLGHGGRRTPLGRGSGPGLGARAGHASARGRAHRVHERAPGHGLAVHRRDASRRRASCAAPG